MRLKSVTSVPCASILRWPIQRLRIPSTPRWDRSSLSSSTHCRRWVMFAIRRRSTFGTVLRGEGHWVYEITTGKYLNSEVNICSSVNITCTIHNANGKIKEKVKSPISNCSIESRILNITISRSDFGSGVGFGSYNILSICIIQSHPQTQYPLITKKRERIISE